jgi:hypothetical protein
MADVGQTAGEGSAKTGGASSPLDNDTMLGLVLFIDTLYH